VRLGRVRQPLLGRCLCPGMIGGRRDHVDDRVMPSLQFLQQQRERRHRGRLNIVQQQNAPPFRLQALKCARQYLPCRNMPPIVGVEIRAPDHHSFRRNVILNRRRSAEPGKPDEWRNVFHITECRTGRRDPIVDFLVRLVRRQPAQIQRMVLRVCADRMTFGVGAPNQPRKLRRHRADDEKICFHALGRELIEYAAGAAGQGSIVEAQNHLVIVQRQGFLVLHGANPGMFLWVDDDDAARSQRIRILRAVRGMRRICRDTGANRRHEHKNGSPHVIHHGHSGDLTRVLLVDPHEHQRTATKQYHETDCRGEGHRRQPQVSIICNCASDIAARSTNPAARRHRATHRGFHPADRAGRIIVCSRAFARHKVHRAPAISPWSAKTQDFAHWFGQLLAGHWFLMGTVGRRTQPDGVVGAASGSKNSADRRLESMRQTVGGSCLLT
jgi:hypothetical protein